MRKRASHRIFSYCGHRILPNAHTFEKRYTDNRTDGTNVIFGEFPRYRKELNNITKRENEYY